MYVSTFCCLVVEVTTVRMPFQILSMNGEYDMCMTLGLAGLARFLTLDGKYVMTHCAPQADT